MTTTGEVLKPCLIPPEWLKPGAIIPVTPETVRVLLDAVRTLSAPQGNAVQEGYVLVPVEPTEEMLSDGWRAAVGKHDHAALAHIYKTMIAAAPSNKEVER